MMLGQLRRVLSEAISSVVLPHGETRLSLLESRVRQLEKKVNENEMLYLSMETDYQALKSRVDEWQGVSGHSL